MAGSKAQLLLSFLREPFATNADAATAMKGGGANVWLCASALLRLLDVARRIPLVALLFPTSIAAIFVSLRHTGDWELIHG